MSDFLCTFLSLPAKRSRLCYALDGAGPGITMSRNGQNRNWQVKDLLETTHQSVVPQGTDNATSLGAKCESSHTRVLRTPFPLLSYFMKAIRRASAHSAMNEGCGYPAHTAYHTAEVVWLEYRKKCISNSHLSTQVTHPSS